MTYNEQSTGGAEGSGTLTDPGQAAASEPATDPSWLDGDPISFEEWAQRLRAADLEADDRDPEVVAAAPDEVRAAVAHFEPLEGERLEHLASRRRGPVRWAAGFVLALQAKKEPASPAVDPGDVIDLSVPEGDGTDAAEPVALVRRRRTPDGLRHSVLRRGGRPDLRPVDPGPSDLTGELLALVHEELASATPPRGVPVIPPAPVELAAAERMAPASSAEDPSPAEDSPPVEDVEAADEPVATEPKPVAKVNPIVASHRANQHRPGLTRSGRAPRRASRHDQGQTPEATAPDTPAPPTARQRLEAAARTAATVPPVDSPARQVPARRRAEAEPEVVAQATGPRPVAPISGWEGTEEDETAWQTWISDPAARDRDGQLASLGEDLARPLPAPLRLAERWGGRRRHRDDAPAPHDD